MAEKDKSRTKQNNMPWIVFGVLALGIVWLWFDYSPKLDPSISLPSNELAAKGQIGDSFGSLNTLFSGLAFAGLICTMLLQMQELRLQREELEDTRKQLRETTDANRDAATAMAKQVEQQQKAAKIAGLAALLDTYNPAIQTSHLRTGFSMDSMIDARNECIRKLCELIEVQSPARKGSNTNFSGGGGGGLGSALQE